MTHQRTCLVGVAILLIAGARVGAAAESQCYGTVANGRIERSVKLPSSGANFQAYSSLGFLAGRTYVHSRVFEVVLAAYGALLKASANKKFVYGETGWKSDGRFGPHRTDQNGLSVDFFVPVMDSDGNSVSLPIGPANKLG